MIRQLFHKAFDVVRSALGTKQTYRVKLYMKSGNVIVLKRVTKFTFKIDGFDITNVSWNQNGNNTLLHIDGSQIESIVQEL